MTAAIARMLSSAVVYTPRPIASALVSALGDSSGARWLDPCVGGGAFVRALHELGVDRTRIVAFDISNRRTLADALADTRRGVDFCSLPADAPAFDRIPCNPPFIALNRLPVHLRRVALETVLPDGSSIRLRSNYWVAFLCSALRHLRVGGNLGFILPASWDNADYAHEVREHVPKLFRTFDVFRVSDRLFGDIQDGCIVVLGRGFREPHARYRRHECATVSELVTSLLNFDSLIEGPAPYSPPVPPAQGARECTFEDVANVYIGCVTGDASFFLLSESERRARSLPVVALRPVLTKAHQLDRAEVGYPQWKRHLRNDERVWLFDPPPSAWGRPGVREYLSLAESDGGCNRTARKVSRRSPWFRVPLPRRVDGFLSGMSRHGPWIALNRMPRLTVSNTLYFITFKNASSPDERAAWSLSLLSSRTRGAAQRVGRVYADGLLKYEPSDLKALPVLIPRRTSGARRVYAQAVRLLLAGDHAHAEAVADTWLRTD